MTAPDPFRGVPLDLDGDVFAWLLGASDSAICVARLADGTFSRVNEAFERLTGFPAADLVGRQVVEIGLMEEVRRAHRRLELRTEGSIRGRETLRTAAGELREVDFAAQIVSVGGEDLVVVVMRGTSEDTGEQVIRRRDAILETVSFAADRFLRGRDWQEGLPDVLARIGEAAEVTRVSAFQAELTPSGPSRIWLRADWAAPGFVPLAAFAEYAGQRETTGFRRWAEALESGGFIQGSIRDLPQNEQDSLAEEEVRSSLSVPVFAGDRWWGFLAFDDCVTERVWSFPEIEALRAAAGILGAAIHTERETRQLRDAESRYRALVEQIPAVTYIDALEGPNTTIYISPQTEPMLGLTQDQWMDDPSLLSKHVHPADRVGWKEAIDRSDSTGEPLSVEYRICTPDGRVVWVHDEAVLVRDAGGRPRFWHGVMFDITARKEAEQALMEALDRERTATQRLRTLDDMKNTFLEAVSHELRTPLTSILGAALTLEREDLALSEEDTRDLVERLAANARKLHRLLSDLLDLDRLSRGIVEPNRQPTDLGELARLVLAESEVLNGRPVEVQAGSVTVSVDAPKVERIIENLLANTARHTPDDTRVWLRVEHVDGGALISVEDAGPGIPAELRDAVFEPFQQVPGGKPHSPGVGVGLTLVARFAELHGGRAWLEERAGGGAAFRVFLPHAPALPVPP